MVRSQAAPALWKDIPLADLLEGQSGAPGSEEWHWHSPVQLTVMHVEFHHSQRALPAVHATEWEATTTEDSSSHDVASRRISGRPLLILDVK